MSRLAIITDVHADVHALRDALAQIERMRCEHIVCAGDLVDWGLFPEETLRELRERRIPCIRGNHDRWATREGRDTSGWDLTPAAVSFLDSLPAHLDLTIDGVRIAVHHARPHQDDMHGLYRDSSATELTTAMERAAARVLIVGHTHTPMVITIGERIILNPGALLRSPVDETIEAPGTFGVLELPTCRFTVHRARDGSEVEIVRKRVG